MVGDVRHELGMRLCLVPAAHDPERDPLVPPDHEAGNNRVQGALSWPERVGMLRFQRE
jgi:hypothetical protein